MTFAVEKKNRCVVELTIRSQNGTLFRAQEEDRDGDMRSAIDEAVNFIDRRIRKNKTRLAKNLRAEALVPEVPAEFDVAEESAYDLVRTKHFAVKPMSTEEAILQMNLLITPSMCSATWRRRPSVCVSPQQRRLRSHRDGVTIKIFQDRGICPVFCTQKTHRIFYIVNMANR